MNRKLLKITLLAIGAGAVLLLSGSGYASRGDSPRVPNALLSALDKVAAEIPPQEAADWKQAAGESPAFFFLLAAD